MKKMTLVCVFSILLILSYSDVFSASPAPYTKEAYNKIGTALSSNEPKYDPSLSKEETLQKGVEYFRNIFVAAGYNYDDTIVKVVDDMRHNPKVLPREPESIFTMIYVGLHFMISECKYRDVDCLQYFRSDSAEAVKWLMNNTEFKM